MSDDKGDPIKASQGKPLKGVIVGLLVGGIGFLAALTVFGVTYRMIMASQGYSREDLVQFDNIEYSLILLLSGFFSVWSGYLTAKISKLKTYKYVAILAVINVAFSAFGYFGAPEQFEHQPSWYVNLSAIIYVPLVFVGGWLWARPKHNNPLKGDGDKAAAL